VRWFSENYTWVFSGIGVLAFGLIVEWFRRRSRPGQQQATLTAQGAKVEHSPVASGAGIIQNLGTTHNYFFPNPSGETPAPAVTEPNEPKRILDEPIPNLKIVGTKTILVHEGLNQAFYQANSDEGPCAVVVNVTNDARRSAPNVGATAKATVLYRDGAKELFRVTAAWMGEVADYVQFRVDDSHAVIVGIAFDGQLSVPSKRRVNYHVGRVGFLTDANPPSAQNTIVTVRLTDADTGEFYCEEEFNLTLSPLQLTPKR
jgi:hypothetical protein